MEKEKYIPIACQFYDVLELHASRKDEVAVAFFKDGKTVNTVNTKLKTLVTKNKQEFLVLADDTEVRLDQIISVGDTQFYGSCGF